MAGWAEMWGFICIISLTGIKHLGNTLLRVSIGYLPIQRRLTVEGEAYKTGSQDAKLGRKLAECQHSSPSTP